MRKKGSKGSEGKVDGAFGPEGCIEGLCPQRGNDSLHFARRFAPSSTAVTDSLDFQVADAPLQIQFASAKCVRCASLRSGGDSPMGLKVVDCPLGNDYKVSVTGLAFVSLWLPRHFERWYEPVWFHRFIEPVKGSREISLQNATLRQSVSHGVSFRLAASSTPSPLRGPLPLKEAQDVTGLAFVSL